MKAKGVLLRRGLTWGLSGAGLQVTGLLAHRLHQGVAATDDVLPLVALDVPHPHTDAAGFSALGNRERGEVRNPPAQGAVQEKTTTKNTMEQLGAWVSTAPR